MTKSSLTPPSSTGQDPLERALGLIDKTYTNGFDFDARALILREADVLTTIDIAQSLRRIADTMEKERNRALGLSNK